MPLENGAITVALFGCGAVSKIFYAPALSALAAEGLTRTVALLDENPERSAVLGEDCPGARRYRDMTDLLRDTRCDLAIIATPNRFHAQMSIACLKRGVHVLCEKPMALTVSECDQMIDAAEAAGCVLAVAHFRRFFPSTRMVKRILDEELLGSVRSFRCTWCQSYNWPGESPFKFRRKESGGGVLMDHGTHMIDLLLWWLGDVADIEYQDDAMGGVEANCHLSVKMSKGASGTIKLSHDWPLLHENRFLIECEKGWIAYLNDVVDRVDWGLRHRDGALETKLSSEIARMPAGVSFLDCFMGPLRLVGKAILGTERPPPKAQAARRGIELIEECYRNRRLLDMPWLDEEELQRARELARGGTT
jgi:predicted dehydrogenase